jgi:hypothetical protein
VAAKSGGLIGVVRNEIGVVHGQALNHAPAIHARPASV